MKYLFLLLLQFCNMSNNLFLKISSAFKVGQLVKIVLCMLPILFINSAQAQFATSGVGLYKDNIFWLDWGNNNDVITSGKTITSGYNIASPATTANRLDITCTASNVTSSSGGVSVYTPGTWSGDALESLYKKTVSGSSTNTLSIGLSNTTLGASANLTISCSATLGGSAFALSGLVFADGEQSSSLEFVSAIVPPTANVRIIDGFRSCTNRTSTVQKTVISAVNTEYTIRNTSGQCSGGKGPGLVGYLENTNTARFSIKGEGKSAIAIGVMVDLDFSEALPSTYGIATHSIVPAWSGGLAVPSVAFSDSATWATRATPLVKLGNTVSPDVNASNSVGSADVNGLSKKTVSGVNGFADVGVPTPDSTFTIPSVSCSGGGKVAGWIDFNGNGAFDSSEKSNVATCAAGTGTVSLSWTVPAVGTAYKTQLSTALRLRTALSTSEITNATGLANSGEVEDYFLALGTVELKLVKQWDGLVTGDQVSIPATTGLITANTNAFTSTSTKTNSTSSNTIVVSPTEVVTLPSETFTPATAEDEYKTASWVCSDGTNPSTTVAQGGDFTIPSASVGKTISCTLTNTAIEVEGLKTASPASGTTVETGDLITYTLKVTVSGGPLKKELKLTDTLGTGLTLVASTLPSGCTASGQVITCKLAANTADGDHSFVYKATVNGAAGTAANPSVKNKLVLDKGTCDNCDNEHPVTRKTVVASQKSSVPAPNTSVVEATIITYTLSTTVTGDSTTSEIVLTDGIRLGLNFFGSVPSGCTLASRVLTCKLPVGTVEGTYNFEYRTIVNKDGITTAPTGGIVNLLEVNQGDCSPCEIKHPVGVADDGAITILKSSNPVNGSKVKIGDTITYTLSVEVAGSPLTEGLVLDDELGSGLTLTGAAPVGCSFDGSNAINCGLSIGTAPGTYTFVYQAIVNNKASSGGINNKVTSNQGFCSSCETNHNSTKVDTFKRVSGVNRENGTSVFIGDTLNFTVTVVVTGGATDTDVVLTDTLSKGLSLSSIPEGCTGKNRKIVCTLPKDSPEGRYNFKYSAVVTSDAANVVRNKVVPSSGSCKLGCETETKVSRKAVLRVTKTTDKKLFKIGDFVRYKILVENLEEFDTTEFFIFDQPAPGLSFVPSSVRVTGDTTWSVSQSFPLIIKGLNIAAGKKLTIEYLMKINSGAGRGALCNSAVADDDSDYVTSNQSKACITRLSDPDFEDTRIFGTVFEDLNNNGVQDEGELGIPGARLVTATGLSIETDYAGRYHIEGIDPGQLTRGRNFIVKLELNSFVDKVKLTTPNPLVKRLTWGLPAQYNFGVKKLN